MYQILVQVGSIKVKKKKCKSILFNLTKDLKDLVIEKSQNKVQSILLIVYYIICTKSALISPPNPFPYVLPYK